MKKNIVGCDVPGCDNEYDLVCMEVQLCGAHWSEFCDKYPANGVRIFLEDKRSKSRNLEDWVKNGD